MTKMYGYRVINYLMKKKILALLFLLCAIFSNELSRYVKSSACRRLLHPLRLTQNIWLKDEPKDL